MTALVWDAAGSRRFETGVAKGVLYADGIVVAWNGLTAVTDATDRTVAAYYQDGIKYLQRMIPGDYVGKISAFTYPSELDDLMGDTTYMPGVRIHDQPSKPFSFSYQTRVGNDLEGIEHGYRLHVIYNVMADMNAPPSTSVGDRVQAQTFDWDLQGVPPTMFGARPTCHVSFDSTEFDSDRLKVIEDTLYGTALMAPKLPPMEELLALASP